MDGSEQKKASPKGLRWPDDLLLLSERTAADDDRDFSGQDIHLVSLGLEERETQQIEKRNRINMRRAVGGEGSEATPRENIQ